ncbi:type II inositol polyphosphate 5-phosphatase 15 isoform X1 [Cryptomeria japonica]|uniref:type II inositol polyphosphate 5-phosphatase 15 isoform X1 n=1 Tax=Cryptomeria japonica TaxID=3369 RepID=UPI0027D9E15D|nr:type II inositol polyphosphate 5-phosphatase 15 isoform X1 [Cryptomeria japonica]
MEVEVKIDDGGGVLRREERRPAPLELRPRPYKRGHGLDLTTICSTESQLWAGGDCGVRVWNIGDAYSYSCSTAGEPDTAFFRESVHTSPTLCLFPDAANNIVWSGHMDGKIRGWAMGTASFVNELFEPILSWQAHQAPVLSMAVTAYGELWTGSEHGSLKAWPWEATKRALSLAPTERHMAVLSMERSYIDLRNHIITLGTCSLTDSDMIFLLSDHSTGRVWSGGYFFLSLWDAQTRDVLKIFGTNAEAEFCSKHISATRNSPSEDKIKINFAKVSTKEKTQGALSFFRRSKNVVLEAADAVRRAAVRRQNEDDMKRTKAIAASTNQMIWTGYANGLLVQWDCQGNRIQEFMHSSTAIECLCALGTRIWIGYADGRVQVMEQDGNLLGGWVAHGSSVVEMAVGSGYVFSLASHGGIRGWTVTSLSPLDSRLRLALMQKGLSYTKKEDIKILAGTWNVNQERPTYDSLISWLASPASEASIVVIGLQEMEMGPGFLAMAAAKETVGLEGSSNGQWWLDSIGKILDEDMSFQRAGSRQLAGLLVAVWVRKHLWPYVGDVEVGAVACGLGRKIGNKGAVALKMNVFRRTLCFINCHFAAHLDAVGRRNADFEHVYENMTFGRISCGVSSVASEVLSSVQKFKGINAWRIPDPELVQTEKDSSSLLEEEMPELAEIDMVIWLGDFNYRLDDISYDEAINYIANKQFDALLVKDQLRREMKAGRVFQGMREGDIKFPPTYKFDRGQAGWQGYTSEKRRVPAWCDRILFRDSSNDKSAECNLVCPIVSDVAWYDSCMDVTSSDHKPVRSMFKVNVACIDEKIRRREYGDLIHLNTRIKGLLEHSNDIPDVVVSTNNIVLQDCDSSVLRLTNTSRLNTAVFDIICEGEETVSSGQTYGIPLRNASVRGCFGFSRWLQVFPASGIICPGETIEVCVDHEDFLTQKEYVDGHPRNSWCEDERDKLVVLLINVRGNVSSKTKQHRICICHCVSSKVQSLSIGEDEKIRTNVLQRSDFHQSELSTKLIPDDFIS